MDFIYKNAFNLKCLKKLQEKLEKINNENLFEKNKFSHLVKILYYEEKILTLISGVIKNSNYSIILTDKRIILIDTTLIFTIINLNEIGLIKYEINEYFGEIFIKYNSREKYIQNISKSVVKLFTNLVIELKKNEESPLIETTNKDFHSKLEKLTNGKIRNENFISRR